MNKKIIMICVIFLFGLFITIKQTNSTPPYEVALHTLNNFGEVTCAFYAGETIYVKAQVNENNVHVSGKEVYIYFKHRGTGHIVGWGNMGSSTDFQGVTYAAVPVSHFDVGYCGNYVLFGQVWENGELVQNQDWTSVEVFPSGCPPPSFDGCPVVGGSPFMFKRKIATEL